MPTQSEISLSPISAKGDILTTDGSSRTRLAVGTNGQILVARSSATSGIQYEAPVASTSSNVSLIYSTTVTAAVTSISISLSVNTTIAMWYVEGKWRCTRTGASESGILLNGSTSSLDYCSITQYGTTAGYSHSQGSNAGGNAASIIYPAYSDSTLHDVNSYTSFNCYIPNGLYTTSPVATSFVAASLIESSSTYDGTTTGTLYGRTSLSAFASTSYLTPTSILISDYNPSFSSIAIGSYFRVYSIKKV
jgi:hypothetical protein